MNARCATVLTTFAATALLLSTINGTTPHYVWNASNSVPIGLYRLQPVTKLAVTELVAVQPPELLAVFLDLNGYLPIGVPMLKRVLALPGQTVCRHGLTIAVDGIVVAQWPSQDGHYPVAAYQTAFGLSLALQAAALVWFAMPWMRTFGRQAFGEPCGRLAGCSGASNDGPILEVCAGGDW